MLGSEAEKGDTGMSITHIHTP